MPSEIVDDSQYDRSIHRPKSGTKKASKSALVSSSAASAISNFIGTCLACGPDHPLQIRELSRCGFRGEGHGAWCGSCRRVYALEDHFAPAA
ncbi:MAG: hypothetical protein ABWZ40_08320 [Caulobacterales bacterium]